MGRVVFKGLRLDLHFLIVPFDYLKNYVKCIHFHNACLQTGFLDQLDKLEAKTLT